MASKLEKEESQLFATMARNVWLRRNAIVFGGILTHPTMLVQQAKEEMMAYALVEQGRGIGALQKQTQAAHPNKWQKPLEGVFKLNWDASNDLARKRMGLGVAVRDHEGKLIAALCATKDYIIYPATAEAIAARKAADLSRRMGLEKVILEGDALEIVTMFGHQGG